jgi:hypothetical protein
MPKPARSNLLFDLPGGLAPILKLRLRKTGLGELYEQNKEDFVTVIHVLYFGLKKAPDIGKMKERDKGFDSFCDYVTAYFVAAPKLTQGNTTDDDGLNVNFFGDALLLYLDKKQLCSMQNLYSPDYPKDSIVEHMIRDMVYAAALEALGNGEPPWGPSEEKQARERIQELREGRRQFKGTNIPKKDDKYFHGN